VPKCRGAAAKRPPSKVYSLSTLSLSLSIPFQTPKTKGPCLRPLATLAKAALRARLAPTGLPRSWPVPGPHWHLPCPWPGPPWPQPGRPPWRAWPGPWKGAPAATGCGPPAVLGRGRLRLAAAFISSLSVLIRVTAGFRVGLPVLRPRGLKRLAAAHGSTETLAFILTGISRRATY
jgi:hypothetical protein